MRHLEGNKSQDTQLLFKIPIRMVDIYALIDNIKYKAYTVFHI